MYPFTRLNVWAKAHELTLRTYRLTDGPMTRRYPGLSSQLRRSIAAIPAKRAPEVVKHLVGLYKKEKTGTERFVETIARLGKDRLKTEVEPFRALPTFEENPEMYFEWGEHETFKAEVGKGECAA